MNLNKFTKAELISRLSKTKKIENNNQSFFKKVMEIILMMKPIIANLIFIKTLLKILKRYKIFRRIWTTLNTIVMGIFGISLFDNFGFEFIRNFGNEMKLIAYSIVTAFTNTQFYGYIASFFMKKEEIPSSKTTYENSSISGITKDTGKISEDNRRNSKIVEWLKSDVKEEIREEESSNTKYYLIALLLLLACLSWYYSDEIRGTSDSIIESVRNNSPSNFSW